MVIILQFNPLSQPLLLFDSIEIHGGIDFRVCENRDVAADLIFRMPAKRGNKGQARRHRRPTGSERALFAGSV